MYENIIVIPFRERETHLQHFIDNTIPLIEKHLPNTKVVVVEQNKGKLFNRGALLNVGFKEYENRTNYFFTHDVDIFPTEDVVKNVYSEQNTDIISIKSAHRESLGGIIKCKHDVIFNMNGFPNYIWGWGIEDRALYYRSCLKKINIKINRIPGCKTLPHKQNVEKYINEKKTISDMWKPSYINSASKEEKEKLVQNSGLNDIKYTILERKMIHNLVELIKVDI